MSSLVGSLLGAGLSSVGNLVGAGLSYSTQKESNKIAKDTLEYNKQLNKKIFQREDTAYQRAKADAKAAGFSPLVAAGVSAGSAGGSVSHLSAPNLQNYSAGQIANAFDVVSNYNQLQYQNAMIDNLNADTGKKQAETGDIGFQQRMQEKEWFTDQKNFITELNQELALTNIKHTQQKQLIEANTKAQMKLRDYIVDNILPKELAHEISAEVSLEKLMDEYSGSIEKLLNDRNKMHVEGELLTYYRDFYQQLEHDVKDAAARRDIQRTIDGYLEMGKIENMSAQDVLNFAISNLLGIGNMLSGYASSSSVDITNNRSTTINRNMTANY